MATPTLKYVAPSTPEAELTFAPEPVVIYGVPGGGDSGIQSIVAGTNVTVDDSDPQNPIVSATGGGGGGAVNSVNGQTGVVVLDSEDVGAASAEDVNQFAQIVQTALTNVENDLDSKAATTYVDNQLATKASATDLDNVFAIATAAVPQTRTISGKPLSANITLDKVDVNLASVDNTSDANKPVSTAQQTALNLKANTSDVVPNTRTVAGKALSANVTLVKGDVGLGSVDNTADSAKPVSTAQQTALNSKVNTADVAGLNTVGWGRAVFIANGGTVPGGTPAYTIVIEAGA